jgi:acyl carrier protein
MSKEAAVQELVAQVKDVLHAHFGIALESMQESTAIKDLGLDSLQILDITMEMEERLGRRLEDLSLPRNPTILDVAQMIHQNVQG